MNWRGQDLRRIRERLIPPNCSLHLCLDFRVWYIFNMGIFMSHRCLLKIMVVINLMFQVTKDHKSFCIKPLLKKVFMKNSGGSLLWCPDHYIFYKTLNHQRLGGYLRLFSFIEFETGSSFFFPFTSFNSLSLFSYLFLLVLWLLLLPWVFFLLPQFSSFNR